MSASEREQAKPAHSERRMSIISEAYDIMSWGEREQAKPAHRERRMSIISECMLYKKSKNGERNVSIYFI